MPPRLQYLKGTRSKVMSTRVAPRHRTTQGFWMLVLGVTLIVASSFGLEMPVIDLFKFGTGLSFAALLAP